MDQPDQQSRSHTLYLVSLAYFIRSSYQNKIPHFIQFVTFRANMKWFNGQVVGQLRYFS